MRRVWGIADPGGPTLTTPTVQRCRLLSFSFTYTAGAALGARSLVLYIVDQQGNTKYGVPLGYSPAPSEVVLYTVAVVGDNIFTTGAASTWAIECLPDDVILEQGDFVQLFDSALTSATDTITLTSAVIEPVDEYNDPK